ncbi:MAG: hypothetical protein ACD_28C00006G0005 [uncultured bacterium]|nr:MAG: hypothetical protein ACD_28C00006G0005 [uncultured bacterium]KKT75701.1 MAG: hypothetical protein UW70_C0030G0020 [Candidatus Peregrinibacteria bacterium GW2011_GWA2_44_7]
MIIKSSRNSIRPPAFTLIELIVVMAILAFLTSAALLDYGRSIQKARLDVAVEHFGSAFEDARVRAQTQGGAPEGESNRLNCWALVVGNRQSPSMGHFSLDLDSGVCDLSHFYPEFELDWDETIALLGVTIQTATTPFQIPEGEEAWIVFTPPNGVMKLYRGSEGSLNLISAVDQVDIGIGYGKTTEAVFSKTLSVVPSTSNFMISSGYDVLED